MSWAFPVPFDGIGPVERHGCNEFGLSHSGWALLHGVQQVDRSIGAPAVRHTMIIVPVLDERGGL